MTLFSSKDFVLVPSNIKPHVPSRLIHKHVCAKDMNNSEKAFNKERQHFVRVVDLPSKTISMSIGAIEPKQVTRKHRHTYETLIYFIRGEGKTIIEDTEVFWEQGDSVYVPVWCWHQHVNLSDTNDCCYVACENAPLLQNIGELAIREES